MTRYHGEHPPHSTCLDVGAMHQQPGSEWVCGAECPMPGDPEPRVTTYEEWRVTGTCNGQTVEIIWVPAHAETVRSTAHADIARAHDPAAEARTYIRVQNYPYGGPGGGTTWTDGPHLDKCTVTVSEWQEANPCPACSGPIRETVGMVCMTCGTDYGREACR